MNAINLGMRPFGRKAASATRGGSGGRDAIGQRLVDKGLITKEALELALEQQEAQGGRLGEILVARGAIERAELQMALSEQVDELDLPPLSDSVAEFAFRDGNILYALKDRVGVPALRTWIDEVRLKVGHDLISLVPCSMEEFAEARRNQGASSDRDLALLPAIRRARAMFAEANELGASDFHLTVNDDDQNAGMLVQFRINGSLRTMREIPFSEGDSMFRAMFQGMASISDAMVRDGEDQHAVISNPQMLRGLNNQLLPLSGIRLSSSQVMRGRNLAGRMLYRRQSEAKGDARLAALGYSPRHLRIFSRLARKTTGINPVTGPTGSGKSTTLAQQIHAILEAREGIRIITIEDPVEYEFGHPLVWQYRISDANSDEDKSRAFAGKLKTALRQDPDVIMVGEVRGLETAQEAINASITGHPVWTTIHTNDGFMTVPRLIGMGVDPFMLGDPTVLSSFTAQRLVKTFCPHCAKPMGDPRAVLPEEDAVALAKWAEKSFFGDLSRVRLEGPGCEHCNGTGQAGRTVIAQVLLTDEELLRDLLEKGAASARRNYMVRSDAEIDMMAHGALKVLAGQVDPRRLVDALGPIEPPLPGFRDLTEDDLGTQGKNV